MCCGWLFWAAWQLFKRTSGLELVLAGYMAHLVAFLILARYTRKFEMVQVSAALLGEWLAELWFGRRIALFLQKEDGHEPRRGERYLVPFLGMGLLSLWGRAVLDGFPPGAFFHFHWIEIKGVMFFIFLERLYGGIFNLPPLRRVSERIASRRRRRPPRQGQGC